MSFRAVLFDLDGTLLDTLADIAESTNTALIRLGFRPHKVDAYRYFIGDGREALAYRALPEGHRDPTTVAKVVTLINTEYDFHWADNTHPYPGIADLLDSLSMRDIKMTVLSNKAHRFTEMMVSSMLARWHFDMIVGASPEVPKKPDPTTAILIANQVGIPPSEFIYLGDSDIDMKTAVAAGMYPVGALWGFRSANELLSGGALALVKEPGELLRLIFRNDESVRPS
ncbi:MAG TPA: HAD family hydrolase [Dehalococcoidales bacterium]